MSKSTRETSIRKTANQKKKEIVLFSVILFVLLIIDQLTKSIAQFYLVDRYTFPVINNFFHFTLVYNKGIAFGLFKSLPVFAWVVVYSVFIVFCLSYFFSKKDSSIAKSTSIVMITAGAMGNLIDRIFRHYVIDFLDFRIWPVFNMADMYITVGAILLGYLLLRSKEGAGPCACPDN